MSRPKWSTVTIALAVIAAVAIASPVLGITSGIKKAIKKEVSRQIDDATGPQGPSGAPGAPGAPGSARAFGHVSATGTITRSKGVVGTTAIRTGNRYCIPLDPSIDASTSNVLVTVDFGGDSTDAAADDEAHAEQHSGGVGCTGNQIAVYTFNVDHDDEDDDDGGGNTPGNDLEEQVQPFSFLVP